MLHVFHAVKLDDHTGIWELASPIAEHESICTPELREVIASAAKLLGDAHLAHKAWAAQVVTRCKAPEGLEITKPSKTNHKTCFGFVEAVAGAGFHRVLPWVGLTIDDADQVLKGGLFVQEHFSVATDVKLMVSLEESITIFERLVKDMSWPKARGFVYHPTCLPAKAAFLDYMGFELSLRESALAKPFIPKIGPR